jgi:hypothetical protein
MRSLKPIASLVAVLALSACGGPDSQEESLVTSSAALTSGVSRGCTFYVSSRQKPGTFPPVSEIVVNRVASSTCVWGNGSAVLGTTYNSPTLSLAANDLGVAVSFTYKGTPSGSAAVFVYVDHVTPDTLSIVRSTALGAMNSGYAGYVYGGELSILSDGTTLDVRGTKSGTIPGEIGSGSNYIATYPDFFTSATPPTVVAY